MVLIQRKGYLDNLKKYTDEIGYVYGSEDLCVHLYSWVKMIKPRQVLEFGTGLGASTLWINEAIKENGAGILHTIDDGSKFIEAAEIVGLPQRSYEDYIVDLYNRFDIHDGVTFYRCLVEDFYTEVGRHLGPSSVDMIFADYNHHPNTIEDLFDKYLTSLSEGSLVFIDSAPSKRESMKTIQDICSFYGFSYHNIYENKESPQASTCCIHL